MVTTTIMTVPISIARVPITFQPSTTSKTLLASWLCLVTFERQEPHLHRSHEPLPPQKTNMKEPSSEKGSLPLRAQNPATGYDGSFLLLRKSTRATYTTTNEPFKGAHK